LAIISSMLSDNKQPLGCDAQLTGQLACITYKQDDLWTQ